MNKERNNAESLPEKFGSVREAADFWDTHDTAEFPDAFSDVEIDVQLQGSLFEIAIDEDVAELLAKESSRVHTPVNRLASKLLRRDLSMAK